MNEVMYNYTRVANKRVDSTHVFDKIRYSYISESIQKLYTGGITPLYLDAASPMWF